MLRAVPFVIAIVLLFPAGVRAQTTDPTYLSQFPTVERVKEEIKGSDSVDTSARQIGALWRLFEIVKALAGPRFDGLALTKDEVRYIGLYNNAWLKCLYKQNAPPVEDQPRWVKLRQFYQTDSALLDEIFKKFLTPAIRADYINVRGPLSGSAPFNPSGQTSQGNSSPAIMSVSNGFPTLPGGANPLSGRAFVLIKESFGEFLGKEGLFGGPTGSSVKASPLAGWAYASRTQPTVAAQALVKAQPLFVSAVKMDSNGKATFPSVAPGTYYLFGQTAYNGNQLLWDLRVDLRAGSNQVTLDQRNTAPINGQVSLTNTTPGSAAKPADEVFAPNPARPHGPANSELSLVGAGYVYTHTLTNRQTGAVVDSFTERGNFSDTTLYLLDEDADAVLKGGGVNPGLLGNRLATMCLIDAGTQVENLPGLNGLAKLLGQGDIPAQFEGMAKADFDRAMRAVQAHSVAQATTDANAKATFARVPAGTYYLYGRFYRVKKPVRGGGMVWDLKVTLKPGPNMLRLSVDDAAWK